MYCDSNINGYKYLTVIGFKIIGNDVGVPMGKGAESGVQGSSLLYNEFIVYDVEQIRMKYLLQVKFDYNILSAF